MHAKGSPEVLIILDFKITAWSYLLSPSKQYESTPCLNGEERKHTKESKRR